MGEISLQGLFIDSHGAPIQVGTERVFQMDRIPIVTGEINLKFLNNIANCQGVAIKSKRGGIRVSDGKWVNLLYVWDDPNLPRVVTHQVKCPDGELRIWNIYRTQHLTGAITTDSWTGNAGMIIEVCGGRCRRYRCSSGAGRFNPDEFKFQLEWSGK